MSQPQGIPFTEYDLDNGLHVILSPSRNVPLVAVNLWYHVGSKDEDPTRTGFAHLFEHMMFQGSKNVGKAEHFKYVQNVGGTLNATTSVDRTNYFETLPESELELGLWLESDRMLTLDVTEENFENQRAVVKEERRQRYENQPYGTVWENIVYRLYPTSGYHWTTIGSMAHLDAASIEDVRAFHREYYKPNNCSLNLTGNFDEQQARRLIEKYFGGIPRGAEIDRKPQIVAPLTEQIRFTLHDAVKLSAVYVAFQAAPAFSRDEYVLDLLSDILDGGRSSRLYRELVYGRQIARDASSFNFANEKAGAFGIISKAQLGRSVQEVEEAIWQEIRKLREAPVSERELEKAKNRIERQIVSSLTELARRADQLQRAYTYTKDTGTANRDLEMIRSVTVQDIQRVAQQYLDPDRAVVAHVLPHDVPESLSHVSSETLSQTS